MAITLNGIEFMRGLNAVDGDFTKLDEVIREMANAKNEDWYKASKSFLNLNNISDDDLSKSEPLVTLGFEYIMLKYYTSEPQNRDISELAPIDFTIENSTDILAQLLESTPIEIKPLYGAGDFERIGYILPLNQSYRINDQTTQIGTRVYSTGQMSNIPFTCKKINNYIKTYVPLNSYIGNVDFNDGRTYISRWNHTDITGRYNAIKNNNLSLEMEFFSIVTNLKGHNYSNVWIFNNEIDCDYYLDTGDYTRAINYHSDYEPPVIIDDGSDGKMLYWYQHAYSKANSKSAKTYIPDLSFEIQIDLGNSANKTLAMQRDFSQTEIQDCNLQVNNSDEILEIRYRQYGAESWEIKQLSFLYTLKYIYRKTRNMLTGDYRNKILASDLNTNIPVFLKDGDVNKYFDDEIDVDSADNSEDLHFFDGLNQNGDSDKEKSELNEISTVNNTSEILQLSTAFLNEFSTFLSNDEELTSLLGGLKLRGNNPISFIVDLFALPFSIDNFVEKLSNNRMFFGSYDKTFTNSYNKIIRNNLLKNVFSTYIMPIYNDWRDYLTNVYIYLPYVNIQPLNYNEIVGKTLSCKVAVDVATGNIKYFIFANGIMIQTIEGSVRQNLPISSTDYYGASMNKVGGASQILNGSLNVASGLPIKSKITSSGLGQAVAPTHDWESTNLGGILSGANAMYSGFNNIVKDAPKSVSGNFSSSSAFFDELNAYLIFEQTNVLYPQSITTQYNMPSNLVGKLSACHGYTEIDNIDLRINCDESIKENILTILNHGFYID